MTTNSQLSTNEPKKKRKTTKTKRTTRTGTESGHHMEGFQWGGGREEQVEKGTGKKKHKWQVKNRQGEVKNGRGNNSKIFYVQPMDMS